MTEFQVLMLDNKVYTVYADSEEIAERDCELAHGGTAIQAIASTDGGF